MENNFIDQSPVLFLDIFRQTFNAIYWRQELPASEVIIFGSRYGGKTHSFNWLALRCLILRLPVTIYIFRYLKGDVELSIWHEFLNKLRDVWPYHDFIKINYSYRKIKHGDCEIYFKGLHQQKKDKIAFKGLFTYQTPYCIAIFEECDEMEPEELTDIQTSMRGSNPDGRLIMFSCGNPLLLTNPFSTYFDQFLPYDENRMKVEKFYFKKVKSIISILPIGKSVRQDVIINRIFIRYCIEANPFALSNPDTMLTVEKWKETNPKKWEAWYWGKPVQIDGDVFSHLVKYIQYATPEELLQNPNATFRVGLDFGYEHNAYAAICLARLKSKEIVVVSELYILPEKVNASHEVMIQRTYLWLKDLANTYPQMAKHKVTVFCDQSDWIYKRVLETGTKKWNWLTWAGGGDYKRLPISLRIGYIQTLLSRQKLYIIENEGHKFIQELNGAEYKKNTQNLQMVKKDDHLLDAFIYGNSEWYDPVPL